MIGFLIGTACLIGLVKVLRFGHTRRHALGSCYGGSWGWGGSCGSGFSGGGDGYGGHGEHEYGGHGPGGWGPPWARRRHEGHRGGFGWRGPFFLRALFQRLDTTPGQEKVIKTAIDELRTTLRGLRGDLKEARPSVARAFRSESFDENSVADVIARVETASDAARKAFIDAFAKIHGAFDEKQREQVAQWIEHGPGAGAWGGF
jgi:hypothetical protein